jgi:hypothetical protein
VGESDLLDWADVAAIGVVASNFSDDSTWWHIQRMLHLPHREGEASTIAEALRESFAAGKAEGSKSPSYLDHRPNLRRRAERRHANGKGSGGVLRWMYGVPMHVLARIEDHELSHHRTWFAGFVLFGQFAVGVLWRSKK